MAESRHWANIAERGSILGMQIILFAHRVGGDLLMKVIMFPVIVFYFLVHRDARLASRDYLSRIREYSDAVDAVSSRTVFSHFWKFAESLIDKFSIWRGSLPAETVEMHGIDLVNQLVAEGRGAVFAISHLGNFEILNAMSQRHPGVELTVLVHTRHAEKFNSMLNRFNTESKVEILQVTELDAALAMRLSEKVSSGGFVAIAADRVPVNNHAATVECQFVGGKARFPTGPHVLACVLSVEVLMLFCIKQRGRYQIYCEQLADGRNVRRAERQEFIRESAQKFASRLEKFTCLEPLQWFNFYYFWESPVVPGKEEKL